MDQGIKFQKWKSNFSSLWQISQFPWPLVKSASHGSASISYLGPKIWDAMPDEYKSTGKLEKFNIKTKR